MVEAAVVRRRRRPMFLLDAAVPGDIEPSVDNLEDAYRYELDDLEKVARKGRAGREAATRQAWQMIDTAVAEFVRGHGARRAVPAVRRLRGHFEVTRDAVLGDASLDAAAATRLLINKLLHVPSSTLRASAGDDPALHRHALRLFGLDDDSPQDDPPGDEQ
jgi:glutamyl-tRNA reductase